MLYAQEIIGDTPGKLYTQELRVSSASKLAKIA